MIARTTRVLMLLVLLTGPMACSGKDDSSDAKKQDKAETTVRPQRSASMAPTEVLDADLEYSTFNKLVAASGIGPDLDDAKALTLFAPTNASLDPLGAEGIAALIADPAAAKAYVQGHAVAEKLSTTDLLNRTEPLVDLAGQPVTVTDGSVIVGGAKVVKADIQTRNGYVHVVDTTGSA